MFLNFLRSHAFDYSVTYEATTIQICYIRHQDSFYLWQEGPVLRHYKIPKFYGHDFILLNASHFGNNILSNIFTL